MYYNMVFLPEPPKSMKDSTKAICGLTTYYYGRSWKLEQKINQLESHFGR